MFFSTALISSLALASGVYSQAPPSGMTTVFVVQVSDPTGSGALTFTPNNVIAPPGSMVQFQFHSANHSVAQSSFSAPCVPLSVSTPGSMGIFSGFMPVAKGASQVPVWSVPINDTKPIWFYCAQSTHCQKGMVGAINAASSGPKSVAAFAALAASAGTTVIPGGMMGSGMGMGSGSGTPAPPTPPPTGTNTTMMISTSTSSAAGIGSTGSTTVAGSSSTTTAGTSSPIATAAAAGIVAGSREVVLGMAVAGFASLLVACGL